MPYEYLPSPSSETRLRLWPHQSLPRTGFVWFIGITAALTSLPLITLIGSPVLWGILPFLMLAVAAIWWALQRSSRDRDITEYLTIWPDCMTLIRHGPHGKRADWQANPYWVTAVLHPTAGPVPNYLTLRGGDREVELGAFLSEEERITLHSAVVDLLRELKHP
jgi:uncharacterized membrane protein